MLLPQQLCSTTSVLSKFRIRISPHTTMHQAFRYCMRELRQSSTCSDDGNGYQDTAVSTMKSFPLRESKSGRPAHFPLLIQPKSQCVTHCNMAAPLKCEAH